MNEKIDIPAPIASVIERLDGAMAPVDDEEVNRALLEVRESLEPADREGLGTWAEVLAFALTPSRGTPSPWGTYFGPRGSRLTADGKTVYGPDIAEASPAVLHHWIDRARSVVHPVLKARYADLAWDMARVIGKVNRDPVMARTAIDAYVNAVERKLRRDVHEQFHTAERALDLAQLLRDTQRRDVARGALLNLHRGAMSETQGLWWAAPERLLNDKAAGLTDAERDQLLADLEGIVARRSDASDPKVFEPFATESAAKRLIDHYNKNGRPTDAKRLHIVVARTFEHLASLGNAMQASTFLQSSINAYRKAELPEESQRVRVEMERAIAKSHEEAAAIPLELSVSKEDMEAFLGQVVVPDVGATFARIAHAFLQDIAQLEEHIKQLQERAPLSSIIGQTIVADRHVSAKVGSVEDDPFGRVMRAAYQEMSLNDIWLVATFGRVIEVHGITPAHLVGWAAQSKLFTDVSLLWEGISAWFAQDFIKAIHVLVPQVEKAVREIAITLGRPVTKGHSRVPGASVGIGMGELLYTDELREALGPELTLHFLVLYTDPRGFNLRNDVAHGALDSGHMEIALASRIIHTLLVLGIWQPLAAKLKEEAVASGDPQASEAS